MSRRGRRGWLAQNSSGLFVARTERAGERGRREGRRKGGAWVHEIEGLKKKLALTNEDKYVDCPSNYIIIDDTDSDPSEPDFEDEAGADIMESSTGSN